MKALLYPVSEIYGAITWARNALYDRGIIPAYHSSLPVLSVGNITAGGTGKTPLCIFIAEELKKRGFSPVILSRGYRGKLVGPYKITGHETATMCGDEPLLMAKRGVCPVIISRRRSDGAKYIEQSKLGDLIILDDGFQHRKLKRDVDIILIDVTTAESINEIISGRLLPYGRLREPRDEGLRRADVIILNERRSIQELKEPPPQLLSIIKQDKRVFLSVYSVEKISSAIGDTELKPCEVVAFCGIAGPQGFFQTLEALNFKIIAKEEFPDHYQFSTEDLNRLRSRYPAIPLVCTEKDFVRLSEDMLKDIYVLRARANIIPAQPFVEYLTSTLARKRS